MNPMIIGLILLLVVAAAVGIALATGGLSGGETGNVKITVVDEDGGAVDGATIQLGGTSGVTGAGGTWQGTVPTGKRALTVTASSGASDPPTFQPFVGMVSVAEGGERTDLTIVLSGWSELAPWHAIEEAVAALADGDASVTLTYSYIPPGVTVSQRPVASSVEILDHVDGTLSTATFKAEIRSAFDEWEALFAAAFSRAQGFGGQLTLRFVDTTETESPPLFGPYADRHGGTGDIRIGMWHMDGSGQVLAYAYGPSNVSNAAGDVLWNAAVDWRRDADVTDGGTGGGFSVKYVAAHEIAHVVGLGHHVLEGSVVFPTAGRHLQFEAHFPQGLHTSQYEITALQGVYAPPV